ncbi:ABC transporter ATP-binding protein [Aestuariivirga sp.]|uniref:ABC transporter ATP-binding protein n=1 Tax=Aestuariivirga sp. TaxID=2650926 RepID=UPI003593C456
MKIKGNAASVEFDHVSKVYGGTVKAVDDISLRVEPGTLVTLLGPSGCGKTTTLRMIAGLEMATSGRILIGERDVTKLPATDRDVSMVFQSYALFPHMNVEENVSYGLKLSGFSKSEVRERADAGLALVGLKGYGGRMPGELSGGQQQRVAVARALVLEPQVLLFDEPLSNLDAKLRRRVREEIRDIQTSLGLTVVYVTHDQEEALAVSDRIVVMNNAVIAQAGTPRELYEAPDTAFVADFIGEANIIPCEIVDSADGRALVRIERLELTLASRGLKRGPAMLAVRPNRIRLAPADGQPGFAGRLSKAVYVGSHWEYAVATAAGDLFVKSLDSDDRLAVNGTVAVSFSAEGPVLLPG